MAQTLGLPTIPGFTYKARPDWIVPNEDYWANTTWVAKTVSLGKEQAPGTAGNSSVDD